VNDERKLTPLTIGLRVLTEEDLQTISEQIHSFVKSALGKRVPPSRVDNYDIVVDINFNATDGLSVNIEVLEVQPKKIALVDKKVIQETLEDTFKELDQWLKENYSQ